MIGGNDYSSNTNAEETVIPLDQFATPLSCATIPPEEMASQSRFQVEYLKLEVVELKELLIALASKYKVSEDKRRHMEQRNSLLLQENIHLNTMANVAERERSEAVEENRATLAKLKEFLNFKEEFHRQALELRRALRKRPKQKTRSTSMTELVSLGASGDASEHRSVETVNKESQTDKEEVQSRPSSASSIESSAISDSAPSTCGATPAKQTQNHTKEQTKTEKKSTKKQNGQSRIIPSIWRDRVDEAVSSVTTVKNKLLKANQEIHTLRNMNDWKTTLLGQKSSDLQRKKDELSMAHKEIVKLRGLVNKLNSEQAAIRYGMKRFVNLTPGRCKQSSDRMSKENSKTGNGDGRADNEMNRNQESKNDSGNKVLQELKNNQNSKLSSPRKIIPVAFETRSNSEHSPKGSEEQLQRLWYLDPVKGTNMNLTRPINNPVTA